MGVCLCKDNITDDNSDDLSSNANDARNLQMRVDFLVLETLKFISTILDDEPEIVPSSMILLHDITERPDGWLCLVKSLIRVIPIGHAMGPSVITLLLDDSPLPSKESVQEVSNFLPSKDTTSTIPCERNFCVILGCLAEKLAGPAGSMSILTDKLLTYLLKNITEETPKDVMLFSLIALEKFAATAENKATIKKKFLEFEKNPLLKLEIYSNEVKDFTMRQIGFCALWSLDNYFLIDNRKFSYETADVENINVMLNSADTSEYLKISADGLEARCDSYSFESVRSTFAVKSGAWYFECLIITSGVMQIGWAQKESNFMSNDGYGIGDDAFSVSFDGCRKLVWHKAKSQQIDLPSWKEGCVIGCFIDIDSKDIIFSLNGVEANVLLKDIFNDHGGFFPAASFMSFQQLRFNFGSEDFKYAPKRPFSIFNDFGSLTPPEKIVLPRHLFLEELRKVSVTEDHCTLCYDNLASIRLIPCQHTGFCEQCVSQLQRCPICRGHLQARAITRDSESEDVIVTELLNADLDKS